jgi:DNA-binding NtrC family response regulator
VHEAEGGTLFLDEVDSLPRPAQVKLLRLLQDGEYRMVGSSQATRARVRVIAAGNGDFRQLLRDGRFREDLYYRLNVLSLALPPLRERRSDIPALSRHFLEKHAALSEQPVKALAPAALDRLIAHEWPGNVRELENTLARAHVLTESATIQAGDLDLPEPASPDALSFRAMKAQLVHQFERTYLQDIVRTHEGNITRAARAAGKNRRAFYELLRKHGLPCASR